MKKGKQTLFLYGLVMALVLVLTGTAGAAPASTDSAPKVTDTQATSVFKDVQTKDSNLIYINYLAQRGIISGFPDGGFHPAEGMTRAQAAALLVKAAGLNSADKKAVFKDVNTAYWAAGSIAAAANAGLLKGYPDGTYHPDEKLTRAQGISLVLRLSKQKDTGVKLPALKDMDDKHWAARSAALGLAAGMVGLSSDKAQFQPDTVCSRGDLSRALAVLITSDPDLNQVVLNGSLEVKKGEVKVNEQTVSGTVSVKAGDRITSGTGAEAQLSYPDGSGLLLKANTQLALKESKGRSYIKQDGSPGTAVEWLLVDLPKGEIFGALAANPNIKEETTEKKTADSGQKLLASRANVFKYLAAEDKAAPWYKTAETKKVKVKVDMPWGVAAVRGSFWGNVVTSGGCSTSSLEGDVQVGAVGGQTMPVPAGQSSEVKQGDTAPTPPAPMTAAQVTGWVEEAQWLSTVAQTIQSNQEAVKTEAVITQVAVTQAPGQPAPVTSAAPAVENPVSAIAPTIPTAPAAASLVSLINQALTQVQQAAGITNIVQLNASTPTINLGNPPSQSTWTSSSSSSSGSGSSDTILSQMPETTAFLQVTSLTMNGNILNLSGRTVPGGKVRLVRPFYAQMFSPLTIAADSNGYFNFSNIDLVNTSMDVMNEGSTLLEQLVEGEDGISYIATTLTIRSMMYSPKLSGLLLVKRGIYTDARTPVVISGRVDPATTLAVFINKPGGTDRWVGTVSASGEFSIPVTGQAPGTQLSVIITSDGASASGNTYIYSPQAPCVTATAPENGAYSVPTTLSTLGIFFDRNVSGDNLSGITMVDQDNSPVALSPSLAGKFLKIGITGSLSNDKTYTVRIPAGIIKDSGNPAAMLGEYSFSFNTPATPPTPDLKIQNSCLNANITANGYFSLGTGNGSALLTDDNRSLAGALTTVRIGDGTNFTNNIYGVGGSWVQNPVNSADSLSNSSQYGYAQNMLVRQDLSLQDDSMEIRYTITNNDSQAHQAGLRIWLDTALGNSDACFRAGGQDISTAVDYTGTAIPETWWVMDSLSNPAIIGLGRNNLAQANPPDKLGIGNYWDMYNNRWEGSYSGYAQNYSVALYWNPCEIAAGTSQVFVMRYGVTGDAGGGIGIQSATLSPGTIPFSKSAQTASISLVPNGLANGTPLKAQLYTSAGIAVGTAVETSITGNPTVVSLEIPASTPGGNYYIRLSGRDFVSKDISFSISAWEEIGISGAVATSGSTAALADYDWEDLYAAYVNSGDLTPTVKKLNSSGAWEDWASAASTGSGFVDLALTTGGNLEGYLAYSNNDTANKAVVMKVYEQNSCAVVGGTTIFPDPVDKLALAFDDFNVKPYLAYTTGSTVKTVQAYVYDSTGWLGLAGPSQAKSASGDLRFALSPILYPYLAYSTVDSVNVSVYKAPQWQSMSSLPAAYNSAVDLTFVPGTPFALPCVAYRDQGTGNVVVKTFNMGQWTQVGSADVGSAANNYVSIAVDNDGKLFVAYNDADAGGRLTVKYCSGGTNPWLSLDTTGITEEAVSEPRVKIFDKTVINGNRNKNIYVIYKDTAGNIKVKRHVSP